MDYLYDGSFDGLLTCIYRSYYQQPASGIYAAQEYQFSLINPSCEVPTDCRLATRVYDAIEQKISADSLQRVYYCFLANAKHKENLILNYLQTGFRLGPAIDHYHTHPAVHPVLSWARKVSFEVHRFHGLLRFADTGSFLYATIEPDHNILALLADHFTDRMAGENFIIHDRKRNYALIYNTKEWSLTPFELNQALPASDLEILYQELWTKYFLHIAIETRTNKKLQAQFVPSRYRHNLVEFRRTTEKC